jgi:HTH-type transcriptional regulator, transcriptional repressor of NAD biosynthesis genes
MAQSEKRWRTGLVVGEFQPPHVGHAYLIRTARSGSRVVHICVADHPTHSIPARLRAQWLAAAFPDTTVHIVPAAYVDHDMDLYAEHIHDAVGGKPDLLYSSAEYGDELAARLGAEAIAVQQVRHAVPITAPAIRDDPVGMWRYLLPEAKAGLCRRVCLTGAGSTGKTTLARRLADQYDTDWVREYGRDYTFEKVAAGTAGTWDTADLVHIAHMQQVTEDEAARHAGPLLFCDTDALATQLWHERYLGQQDPEIAALVDGRSYDLNVLCGDEIELEDDGVRDVDGRRGWMQQRFREELAQRPEPWIEVRGTVDERMAAVNAEIDRRGLLEPASIFDRQRFST